MAQENPNRFSEWLLLLRRQAPLVRQHAADWFDAVREEPALLWHTRGVRFGTYALVGLLLAWGAIRLTGALAPPPPSGARPEATSADFHVVCDHPDCGAHFVIHREFGFDGFPVSCPRCKRTSGVEARRCVSAECRSQWVAPLRENGTLKCPNCGRRLD